MLFIISALLLSLMVGYAMKSGGLCTYTAAQQIVRQQRYERLLALLAAAAWAALLVLPLAWLLPGVLHAGGTHGQWLFMLAGGMLLGAGAWLNRGCVFGTFVQLTGGNLNYLATLAGMAGGALGTRAVLQDGTPLKAVPGIAAMSATIAALWLLLAIIIILLHAHVALRSRQADASRPAKLLLVALVLGMGGGWLFATISGWDFAAVLLRGTQHAFDGVVSAPTLLAVGCTLMMTAGGITAAVRNGRFSLQWPKGRLLFACLGVGMLMGAASVVLPDGNDGLLLSGIPVLAPHALAGFAVMLVVMMALLALLPNDDGYFINGNRGRQRH